MKLAKTLLKAGVGVGAAVLGAGALVYEGALNTKINRFFIEKFDKPKEAPAAEQPAAEQPVVTSKHRPDWFAAHRGPDRVIYTEKTGRIHAYIIPAETPSHKWAVLNHGYNSEPSSVAAFAVHYRALGYNCICPSLYGWGNDETHYCSMGYRDKDMCIAWINYIVLQDPEAEIVIHGYSMGAVTTMLATGETLPPNVKAAVADCGFTSCEEQFGHVIRQYAHIPPFPLLDAVNLVAMLRGNFNLYKNVPIEAVARSVTPTVFLHGTADDFVPFAMMDRLYEACAAPKAKQAIEGADHANAVEKDPVLYWKTVDAFLADKISG